jgi:hypothetical protein
MVWNMMRITLRFSSVSFQDCISSGLSGTLAVGLCRKIVDLDAEMVCQGVGCVVNIGESGWGRRKGCSLVLEIGRRKTVAGNTPIAVTVVFVRLVQTRAATYLPTGVSRAPLLELNGRMASISVFSWKWGTVLLV